MERPSATRLANPMRRITSVLREPPTDAATTANVVMMPSKPPNTKDLTYLPESLRREEGGG